MTRINYVSLHPFRRCWDIVEQRTQIHSICLNILVPFTFCFLYGQWTWYCSLTAWSFFLPEANILNVLTVHETLFETHIFFSFRTTHTPKKPYQYVVREAFLLVHWSLQLWNPLQDNNLKFLWQRFGFLMPKHFLDLFFA